MSLVHNRCECKWDGCKAKSGIEGKMFLSVEISTRFQLVFSQEAVQRDVSACVLCPSSRENVSRDDLRAWETVGGVY